MKKFIVLGAGPAGLMSAHAASMAGYDVRIISKKRKSEMYGAQYLHRPIPGITGDPFEVNYLLEGSESEYRRKVYGENWDGNVSPEDLIGQHSGWDIRSAYDQLWKMYYDRIEARNLLSPGNISEIIRTHDDAIVASTIPVNFLCGLQSIHAFAAQEIWAIGDAPERGVFCPITQPAENTVICNGESSPSWYRASNILGYRTAEWPEGKKPPIDGITKVTKPLATTCDCFPMVHRIGRYGKWQKGVLSHEAFYETAEGLELQLEEIKR